MKLRWSKRADADLIGIWRHVAQDNPAASDALLFRLQSRCDLLRDFPKLGPLRQGRRKDIRQLTQGEYLIFYRIAGRHIDVVRVLHGRRDLEGW